MKDQDDTRVDSSSFANSPVATTAGENDDVDGDLDWLMGKIESAFMTLGCRYSGAVAKDSAAPLVDS